MIYPLLIAPYIFCDNSAGIVEMEFVQALINAGIQPTVICKQIDGKFSDKFNGRCNIIQVKENKLFFYLEKVLRYLHIEDLILTPDYDRYSWNRRAKKTALKLNKCKRFDYVHTFSFPSSAHLVGCCIKEKIGLPFVAQFYDPWVGNPIRKIKSHIFQKYDKRLEEKVAKCADIIIHTNTGISEDWVNRYGNIVENKLHVLPIINSVVPEKEYAESKSFTINHIGSLYSGRTAKPFIEAINIIKLTRPDLLPKLQVNFIGGLPKSDQLLISKYQLHEIINNLGRKTIEECDCYYGTASMFLAIDCSYDYDYFYPSKLLKYFSYQKPILGIASGETVLKSEMIASGNYYFSMNKTDEIANFIIECLDEKIHFDKFDKEYYKKFLPKHVSDEFLSIVSRILRTK